MTAVPQTAPTAEEGGHEQPARKSAPKKGADKNDKKMADKAAAATATALREAEAKKAPAKATTAHKAESHEQKGPGLISRIAGFFGKRIQGVAKGLWGMTGGAAVKEVGGVAHAAGLPESKEQDVNKIAGLIEWTRGGLVKAFGYAGKPVEWAGQGISWAGKVGAQIATAPIGFGASIIRGGRDVVTGLALGKTAEPHPA